MGGLICFKLRASINESLMVLPSSLVSLFGGWPVWSLTTRNFLTRPPLAHQGVPFARRGPSEAARCASTEDHQAPSPPLFCEQEDDQATLSSLFEQPSKPRLNLVQPLSHVGLKHIGLGLYHPTLGLKLILEQHQFSKQLLLL